MNSNLIFKEQTLKFNKEEQNIFILQQHNNDWANIFKEMILQGRDKVTQRLVTSMHRENLVKARTQSKKILSRDLIMLDISTTHILEIQFPQAKQTLYAPITGEHALIELMLKALSTLKITLQIRLHEYTIQMKFLSVF